MAKFRLYQDEIGQVFFGTDEGDLAIYGAGLTGSFRDDALTIEEWIDDVGDEDFINVDNRWLAAATLDTETGAMTISPHCSKIAMRYLGDDAPRH